MKAPEVLALLREHDIQVQMDGDRLRCRAPAGALTPAVRQVLQQHKDEILNALRSAENLAAQQRAIVPLQSHGDRPPIFAVGGHNGDVFCFRALARHLGENQPFYGLQPPGLDGTAKPLARVGELAAYFARQIRTAHPAGPCTIAGYCAGGGIAFELARHLVEGGYAVESLALFGSPFPTWYRRLPQYRERARRLAYGAVRHARALVSLSWAERRQYLVERLGNVAAERNRARSDTDDPVLLWRDQVGRATLAAVGRYVPSLFPGRLNLFWPSQECTGGSLAQWSLAQWSSVVQSIGQFFGPDGVTGATMLLEPAVAAFAEMFRRSAKEGTDLRHLRPGPRKAPPSGLEAGAIQALPL